MVSSFLFWGQKRETNKVNPPFCFLGQVTRRAPGLLAGHQECPGPSPGHQAELPWHPLPPLHQAPLLPLTLADLQAHRAAQGLDSTEPPDFEVHHPEPQADQVFLSGQGIQGGAPGLHGDKPRHSEICEL